MFRPSIGFIGAGKAGTALARLWSTSGYSITAVFSRTPEHASRLAQLTGADRVNTPDEVVLKSDLIFLTVHDDALGEVSRGLSRGKWDGKAAVHTSGSHGLEILSTIEETGGMVGSLHPVFPFANAEVDIFQLHGATYALEASNGILQGWLKGLISDTGGQEIILPPGTKALYHAALVMASNYTVSLYAAAERLLLTLGAPQSAIDNALNTLMRATVDNLRSQGIPDALTGPLVRGDTGTIKAHLAALDGVDADLAEVYRQLARLTFPVIEARGVVTQNMEAILQQDRKNCAIDDT
jgi:predicted short-subunit dehydrogenase-like oxidoreductase (DUF2520 family)